MRTFTLAEANAQVPRLERSMRRCVQLVAQARTEARLLRAAGVELPLEGPLLEILPDPERLPSAELQRSARRAWLLLEAANAEAEALLGHGLAVRDLERGLVDLRSVIDGQREVWLCWQLGEREVGHFHELDSGFVGRQPIRFHRFFRSRQLLAPPSSE